MAFLNERHGAGSISDDGFIACAPLPFPLGMGSPYARGQMIAPGLATQRVAPGLAMQGYAPGLATQMVAPGRFGQRIAPGLRRRGFGDDGQGSSLVKIDGIPMPVSGPQPNLSTFRRIEIPSGARGTTATLKKMAELTVEGSQDPYFVEEYARPLARGLASKDYVGEARNILRWVKDTIRYTQDPYSLEWLQSPGWTVCVEGMGDCDDMCSTIGCLALALGHGCTFRALKLDPNNPSEFSHVYCLINIRDDKLGPISLAADPVPEVAELGWEPPRSMWLDVNDLVVAA